MNDFKEIWKLQREKQAFLALADGAIFRVFEPRHGSRGEIFDRSGALAASLDVAAIEGGFEFRLGGAAARSLRIAIANCAPAKVEGATLSRDGFFAVLSDCAPVVRVFVR